MGRRGEGGEGAAPGMARLIPRNPSGREAIGRNDGDSNGQLGLFSFALAPDLCHIPRPVANPSESVQCRPLEVQVGDKGIERAIKHLKRKMAGEGILRELKRRRHNMKPSVKLRKKIAEAARRRRKRVRPEDPRF